MVDFEENSNVKTSKSKPSKAHRKRGRRREQHEIVMDLFLALFLCLNVTPVYTPADEAPGRSSEQV